jgi:hypothetical protein
MALYPVYPPSLLRTSHLISISAAPTTIKQTGPQQDKHPVKHFHWILSFMFHADIPVDQSKHVHHPACCTVMPMHYTERASTGFNKKMHDSGMLCGSEKKRQDIAVGDQM